MTATVTLLLSEDDPILRDILEIALVDAGFTIVIARNGTKALAELEADAARFGAIITDIKLGSGPDGWEVSRRARELVSEIPIIYMSGDSAQDWLSKGAPSSLMITKPFTPVQLITAISSLIADTNTHRTN
jgi:DNA-binding response OmpR family regulator